MPLAQEPWASLALLGVSCLGSLIRQLEGPGFISIEKTNCQAKPFLVSPGIMRLIQGSCPLWEARKSLLPGAFPNHKKM